MSNTTKTKYVALDVHKDTIVIALPNWAGRRRGRAGLCHANGRL